MRSFFGFVWLCLKEAFRHSRGVIDLCATALGLAIPFIQWLRPSWLARYQESTVNALYWQVPVAVVSTVVWARLVLSPYWVYSNAQRKYATEQAKLKGDLDKARRHLLPANHTHVALDRLYELGREGKTMLERLRQNQEPIPTSKDVDAWADNLASVASSVGSYSEKGSFKVHYRYLGLPPIVLNVDGFPAANTELAKSIKAKLSLNTALTARLLREDMFEELMPPS